jgi:hypothetical protein
LHHDMSFTCDMKCFPLSWQDLKCYSFNFCHNISFPCDVKILIEFYLFFIDIDQSMWNEIE